MLMSGSSTPPIVSEEIRIVDPEGRPRLLLSAASGAPTVAFLDGEGAVGLRLALDAAGHPSAEFANPRSEGPSAKLEIDDKGAHVKFDRPGGGSAYLFLSNAGSAGVVLIDAQGTRRLAATLSASGEPGLERFDDQGRPL
jgi:hypothetical protein